MLRPLLLLFLIYLIFNRSNFQFIPCLQYFQRNVLWVSFNMDAKFGNTTKTPDNASHIGTITTWVYQDVPNFIVRCLWIFFVSLFYFLWSFFAGKVFCYFKRRRNYQQLNHQTLLPEKVEKDFDVGIFWPGQISQTSGLSMSNTLCNMNIYKFRALSKCSIISFHLKGTIYYWSSWKIGSVTVSRSLLPVKARNIL